MFVVLGTTTVDLFVSGLDRVPGAGADEFTAANFGFCEEPLRMALGGNGGSAYTLARLGASVALCSAIGRDELGAAVGDWLREAGVGTTGLWRSDRAATSTTVVVTDAAQRRLSFHHPGATSAFGPANVSEVLFEQAHVLLVTGYPLLEGWRPNGVRRALQAARRNDARTALDIGPAIGTPVRLAELAPLLPHVDYLLCNTHELSTLTGTDDAEAALKEAAENVLQAGAQALILKRGRQGARAYRAGRPGALEIAGFAVEARQTVGAGDAFNAGFLFGVQRGWALRRAVRFAHAVAARVVQNAQGVLGSPSLADVEALLEKETSGESLR